jgi:hypothetical protein
MTDDKLDLAGRVPAPRLSFVICHLSSAILEAL